MRLHPLIAPAALALCAAVACGDSEPDESNTTTTPDAGTVEDAGDSAGGDAGSTDAGVLDGSGSAPGWGVVTDVPTVGYPVLVAKTFDFIRESEPNVSDGFNLDDRVSTEQDNDACRIGDFTSPRGDEGVDNQFARLVPLIEAAGGSALSSLVQAAINEGDLLVLIQVDGLDDVENDDNISISIMRGRGETFIGTDGLLLPSLSFDIDTNEAISTVENVAVVDGVAEAGPFEVQLPIFVFDFRFDVTLLDGRIRLEFSEDGTAVGLIGGAVTIDNVLDIADTPGIQGRIPALIESLGATMADLSVEAPCDAFSVAVGFNLIPAFTYAEPPDELPPTDAPAGNGDGDDPNQPRP